MIFKVAKIGKDAGSTDPNDFIFHSDYNTFKIIAEGTKTVTLLASTADQSFTEAHGLAFHIPLVSAFAKEDGLSQVFAPNGKDITYYAPKGGIDGDIIFNYIESDSKNIIFNFDNDKVSAVDVDVRYFLLEGV